MPAWDAGTLTFEKLLAAQAELLARVGKSFPHGPVVTAVWCVDRPALVRAWQALDDYDAFDGAVQAGRGYDAASLRRDVQAYIREHATFTVAQLARAVGCSFTAATNMARAYAAPHGQGRNAHGKPVVVWQRREV